MDPRIIAIVNALPVAQRVELMMSIIPKLDSANLRLVRARIEAQLVVHGVPPTPPAPAPAPPAFPPYVPPAVRSGLRYGDYVQFRDRRGVMLKGMVIRVNTKSCTVAILRPDGTLMDRRTPGGEWRVGQSLLTKIERPAPVAATPAPAPAFVPARSGWTPSAPGAGSF